MPGAASLRLQQYYAHPQNAFWPIMESMFSTPDKLNLKTDYATRIQLLLDNGIALWDVLQHCFRPGSLDARIVRSSIVCNNFVAFLEQHPLLTTIAFNGKTADQLFRKHVLKDLNLPAHVRLAALPSSSPAMATLNRDQKIARWKAALACDQSG